MIVHKFISHTPLLPSYTNKLQMYLFLSSPIWIHFSFFYFVFLEHSILYPHLSLQCCRLVLSLKEHGGIIKFPKVLWMMMRAKMSSVDNIYTCGLCSNILNTAFIWNSMLKGNFF